MDATHSLIPCSEQHDVPHSPAPARRRTDPTRHPPEESNDLLPMRGVLIAIVLGAGFWTVLLAAGWLVFS